MVVAFWDHYIITGDIILYIYSCSSYMIRARIRVQKSQIATLVRRRLDAWDLYECTRKFGCVGARKELFSGKRTYCYIIIYYVPIYIYVHITHTHPTRPAADVVPRVYNIYIYILYNILTHTHSPAQTYSTNLHTYISCVLFARLCCILYYVV